MAALYISEFKNLAFCDNGVIHDACDASEWITNQTVAIGGTSRPSAGFNIATRYLLLSSDVVCSIAWTLATDTITRAATAGDFRIPANTPIRFGFQPGMKVSAITNT